MNLNEKLTNWPTPKKYSNTIPAKVRLSFPIISMPLKEFFHVILNTIFYKLFLNDYQEQIQLH